MTSAGSGSFNVSQGLIVTDAESTIGKAADADGIDCVGIALPDGAGSLRELYGLASSSSPRVVSESMFPLTTFP